MLSLIEARSSSLEVLKDVFGFDSFKGKQEAAISAVLAGRDCFVLMPTGGGKSLCYSLPALLKAGVALIVSPLIALMENQVANLRKNNIRCDFLSSTKTAQDRANILQDIKSAAPTIRLLFITPELLSTEGFMGTLKAINSKGHLTLFAVDEAHCISSWGHDFRPAYRRLGMIRQQLPGVPIMALTATAAPQVQDDIIKQLRIPHAVKLVASFNRPNIHYSVRFITDAQPEPLPHIVALLKEGRRAAADGAWPCSIIYALKKESTEEIAAGLTKKGIPAQAYHAGRPAKERSQVLEDWNEGRVPVVAATIAFGMGIDRANVRLVVHYSLPKTLEGFYQESGRAGRDDQPACSVVFYGLDDRDRMDWILAKQKKSKGKKRKADDSDQENTAAVAAFGQVVAYCVTQSCRRALVLRHFGETLPQGSCTGCDGCQQPEAVRAQLHQLDSEVLQHAQEKAQRFGSKANKLPRSGHRAEVDPFADTGPTGQYTDILSDDDEMAGVDESSSEVAAAEEAVRMAGRAAAGPGKSHGRTEDVLNRLEAAEAKHNRLQQEATSSQRLSKLLKGKGKAKPKQAGPPSQQQAASAITPAMRQHARARISHALQDNPALELAGRQAGEEDQEADAEAAASRWECGIFQSSSSKSAYLSKLSNAISKIKRASDFAQLGIPSTASEPSLARRHERPAQNASVPKPELSQGEDMVDEAMQQPDPEARSAGQNQQLSALQSVSESELKRLMGLLSGTDPGHRVVSATLKQLKQVQVSQQLLLSTGAGKAMKAMTKGKTPEVSEAAQQVVKAWKRCLLQA